MTKIGFIGIGNMGRAMVRGLAGAELYAKKDILIYNRTTKVATDLADELGITAVNSLAELATCQLLVLGVKPHILPKVAEELSPLLNQETVIISVAAGVSLADIQNFLGNVPRKVVRVMPNTPALVGAGMSSVTPNDAVNEIELTQVLAVFRSFGKAEVVPEAQIDAVVGVSGSAPAYVYLFIEALADGAVLEGMSRPQAYEFAAQTVLGAAQMVLETNQHPGALKDMVTSPGGTTIAAVKVLEDNGFRSAVINAVAAAAKKNHELGEK